MLSKAFGLFKDLIPSFGFSFWEGLVKFNERGSMFRSFLIVLVCSVLSSCGDTKSLSVNYLDSTSSSPNLPSFLVYISSDLASNFRQAITPAILITDPSTKIYYYTSRPQDLKDCVLAQNLVDRTENYHSESVGQSNCVSLGALLRQEGLFPVVQGDLDMTGKMVDLSADGFVYTYFFYNPTATTTGPGAAAGETVAAGNRCFKLWGSKVVSKQLISAGGQATQTVDLKNLKCFGF